MKICLNDISDEALEKLLQLTKKRIEDTYDAFEESGEEHACSEDTYLGGRQKLLFHHLDIITKEKERRSKIK